jgi:hypothetical protein
MHMSEKDGVVTDEFKKVIHDFINDLRATFPEYEPLINKWWKPASSFDSIENEEERTAAKELSYTKSTKFLFEFCKKKLPPRFFDILYQNEDMYKEGSDIDTEFLPHIHFKDLWSFDITQKTRDTIWKYLQLILFSIVGKMDNSDMFGDTAKLFEGIDEEEFRSKLEETMLKMQEMFDSDPSGNSNADETKSNPIPNIPNAEEMHNHISGMLDGKLGKLAKEIAEETANDLNMDMENVTDMKGVFSNLVKNPTKLMGLVKNVGDKIDTKIKSGELKESELIAEATEMMNKMKGMPGMGDIQSMLNKMGMGNMGKLNMGAMEAQMNRNMKTAKMKERFREKAEANRLIRETNQAASVPTTTESLAEVQQREEQLLALFNTKEKAIRTPRTGQGQGQAQAQPQIQQQTQTKNKKKKGKK